MATTYTTNVRLQKPATADRGWDVPINANADYLDSLAVVGALAVRSLELPSVSLTCQVTAGPYTTANGTPASFAGTSLALPASATSMVWLSDAGIVNFGASFPTTPHLRLAQVVTGSASISQVIDARVPYRSSGANTLFVSKAGDTIAGPVQVTAPSTGAPVLSLDPVNGLVGFFGTAAASQAPRLNLLVDNTGGAATDSLTNVGTSFSQATLNNNFASLSAKVDSLIAALKRHGLMGG